jgi:hypothetical protein
MPPTSRASPGVRLTAVVDVNAASCRVRTLHGASVGRRRVSDLSIGAVIAVR